MSIVSSNYAAIKLQQKRPQHVMECILTNFVSCSLFPMFLCLTYFGEKPKKLKQYSQEFYH